MFKRNPDYSFIDLNQRVKFRAKMITKGVLKGAFAGTLFALCAQVDDSATEDNKPFIKTDVNGYSMLAKKRPFSTNLKVGLKRTGSIIGRFMGVIFVLNSLSDLGTGLIGDDK